MASVGVKKLGLELGGNAPFVAIKIGDGAEQGVVQGPLIDAVLKIEKHIDDAMKGGANVSGVKESGLGREGSHHGMENTSRSNT